ncbi:protein NLRC3-like [Dysidea avara]|uniref:protein NLRC3-like n=1 Tax=Dysidea avara TaxID=196820 RepID=UPI0033282F11
MSGIEHSTRKSYTLLLNTFIVNAPSITTKQYHLLPDVEDVKWNSTWKSTAELPTTKLLMNNVVPLVATHWYELGLELLGETSFVLLDQIAKKDKLNHKDCCAKMLTKWQEDQSSNATWDQLIKAMKFIGLSSVASDLEQQIQQLFLRETAECLKKEYKMNCQFSQEPLLTVRAKHCPIDVLTTSNGTKTVDLSYAEKDENKLDTTFQILTTVTSLFCSSSKQGLPSRVLIEGIPGIGKTFLAKEVAYHWAKGSMLTDYQLLFLLLLRDPVVQKITTLLELVQCFTLSTNEAEQVCNYLQSVNGKSVLFLLDGYDEMPSELCCSSFLHDLISGKCLTNARVMVTSRPTASSSLCPLVDHRIEILGFSNSSRVKYITEALQDSSVTMDLIKYLQQHPSINAVCCVPLTLSLLIDLFKMDKNLPTTTSELYKSFIILIVRKNLKEMHQDKVINEINHLPPPACEMLLQLSKLAFQGLLQDKIVFTFEDLPELLRDNPTCYGLLQSVEHYSVAAPTSSFNFIHFSLQEYFAAFHVSNLPKVEVGELLVKSFLRADSSLSVRLSNMWIFYFGITGGQCTSLRSYVANYGQPMQYGQQMLASKDFLLSTVIPSENSYTTDEIQKEFVSNHEKISQVILEDHCKVLQLYQCFYEAKDISLCKVLANTLDNTITLENKFVETNHLISLCLFLLRSPGRYKELNLFGCHIGDHGIYWLSQFLCGNGGIKIAIEIINVMDNDLTEASMSFIAELVNHFQPHTLKLGSNQIQRVDVISLVMVSSLTALNLWGCDITAPAGTALAKMITFLTELNIGNNKLGDAGAELLSEGIRKSLQLQVLNLNNNSIGPRGAVAIIDALSNNISLVVLNISNNAIGEEGAMAIAKTVRSNLTLQKFLLCGDATLDEDLAVLILESLSRNVRITNIGFPTRFADGNRIKSQVESINVGRVKYHDPKLVLRFAK